jgi:hypothetical protein
MAYVQLMCIAIFEQYERYQDILALGYILLLIGGMVFQGMFTLQAASWRGVMRTAASSVDDAAVLLRGASHQQPLHHHDAAGGGGVICSRFLWRDTCGGAAGASRGGV